MIRLQWAVFILLTSICSGQAPVIQWQHNVGGNEMDVGQSIIQTQDGGYLVASTTSSSSNDVPPHNNPYAIWLKKLDAQGEIEWDQLYGPINPGFGGMKALQTLDGGYIFGTTVMSTESDVECTVIGFSQIWIVKLDTEGQINWQRCLGGSANDSFRDIEQTSDHGYIVVGSSASTDGDVIGNHGQTDILLVKIDQDGSTQWSKPYGGSAADAGRTVYVLSDGGFLVAGGTRSNDQMLQGINPYNTFHGTAWLLRLDPTGVVIWQKCYGGNQQDLIEVIGTFSDGTFWGVGQTSSTDGDISEHYGAEDGWVIKFDKDGELLISKCFGGSGGDLLYSASPFSVDQLLVVGITQSVDGDITNPLGATDVWTMQLNSDLNKIWSANYGGTLADLGNSISSTADGGAVFCGLSQSNNGDLTGNHGESDVWVVKLAPWDDTSLQESADLLTLTVHPIRPLTFCTSELM